MTTIDDDQIAYMRGSLYFAEMPSDMLSAKLVPHEFYEFEDDRQIQEHLQEIDQRLAENSALLRKLSLSMGCAAIGIFATGLCMVFFGGGS